MTRYIIACAVIVVLVSVAAAQQKPEPVIRLGDWVEIGNEAFMNVIAVGDFRFNTSHNMDFEEITRDRVSDRDVFSTVNINQENDAFFVQARWGADFRYQKNFRFQVILQWEGALDGNLIDDRHNEEGPEDIFGNDGETEDESTNLERLWLQYTFPGTPLRIHVGSDLWIADQTGVIGDDDPRFGFYLDLPGDLELGAWAVLQTESLREGLQNDHDFWYYVFHAAFKGMKPFTFGLDIVYFRDRSSLTDPNLGAAPVSGRTTDSVLIMPSWSGTFGPITALLQPMIVFGSADSAVVLAEGDQREYDIFAWGGVAYLEANLGIVAPYIGFVIGSADDDPGDRDLNGFAPLPQREITQMTGARFFNHLDTATGFGTRDIVTPGRAVNGAAFGGQEFGHTVGNPFNDRLANGTHPGMNTTYSNPGTLVIPAGVKIFPVQGHELNLAYIYRAMLDADGLSEFLTNTNAVPRNIKINETLYHEIMLVWEWTLSRHFDIRASGSVLLPGEGAKDIAELSQFEGCATAPGLQGNCQGEDVGFHGQLRFRALF
jgi:hypothetical protein